MSISDGQLANAANFNAAFISKTKQVQPTYQKFTVTGSTVGWLFTVTSANATVGATYTNNGNTYTVLSTIAPDTFLYCSQASAPQASGTLTKASGTGDASITFSASQAIATYTLPTSPTTPSYIHIRLVGAGGGGCGGGTTGTFGSGVSGTKTTFAYGIRANGGGGAIASANVDGGFSAGSNQTALDVVATGVSMSGGSGNSGNVQLTTANSSGGVGAASFYGGGGRSRIGSAGTTSVCYGSGGGGGGMGTGVAGHSGGGGGAGGFCEAIIYNPSATYYYCVGVAGTGGTAGTSGYAGGAGSNGILEVWEHYI